MQLTISPSLGDSGASAIVRAVQRPDAADEAGASDGASPLIWVFYGDRGRGVKPVPPFLVIRGSVSFWVEDSMTERSSATVQALREDCYRDAVFYDAAGVVWPVLRAEPMRWKPGLLDRLLPWRRVSVTLHFGDPVTRAVSEVVHQLRAIIEGNSGFEWHEGSTPSDLIARFTGARNPAEVIEVARQIQ